MPSFPMMWEELSLGPVAEDGCPVMPESMATYLDGCAYHYLLDDEPPPAFGALTLALKTEADNCRFWIWTCEDSAGRPWFVVAESGPHNPSRWVHADSHESWTSAEDYLEFVPTEFRMAHGRSQ